MCIRDSSGPVGPQHGQHVTVADGDVEVDAARRELGPDVKAGHHVPVSRLLAVAMTISAATTMSNSDKATAASASVSRCR